MTRTFDDLWSQFASQLRLFIRGRVADASAADDILQVVFLRIHNKLGQLRAGDKVESWIYRITRNAITDHYRQLRPMEPLDEQRFATENLEPVRTEGEREALLAAFRRLIAQLPDPYREAIELTELNGMSQSELAQHLGISLSGAKSRVQRGRAQLKEALLTCCRLEFDRRGGVLECKARSAADCPECA